MKLFLNLGGKDASRGHVIKMMAFTAIAILAVLLHFPLAAIAFATMGAVVVFAARALIGCAITPFFVISTILIEYLLVVMATYAILRRSEKRQNA